MNIGISRSTVCFGLIGLVMSLGISGSMLCQQPPSPFNMLSGHVTGQYLRTPRGLVDVKTGQFVGSAPLPIVQTSYIRAISNGQLQALWLAAGSPGNPPFGAGMLHGQLNANGAISWSTGETYANVTFSAWYFDSTKSDTDVLGEALSLYLTPLEQIAAQGIATENAFLKGK